jgi:two-component system, NarL family, response regulator LiaR
MIRLAVIDDHPAVRLSYSDFLDAHDSIEVVGEGENGREAVELCRTDFPDVIVMDIRMPVMDGIEATRLIKSVSPTTRVILVSAYEQPELIDSAHRAGADLFVLKGVSGAELAGHVHEVASCS